MGDGPATVALVAHRFAAGEPTGIGRYYRELAVALAEGADPAGRRHVAVSTREPLTGPWAPPSLEVVQVPGDRRWRALGWALTGRPPVDRFLGDVDLVHLLHPWTVVPTRAPLVVTVHDLMVLQHPRWYGRAEAWMHRRGLRHAVAHAARFVVNSEHTGRELINELGVERERVRVAHLGVGEEFRRRPAPAEVAAVCTRHRVEPERFVVAVGAVSERKNLGTVLRALAALDPAVRPVLVAAGPRSVGADGIVATAERLGVAQDVRWTGFVGSDDLPALLSASAALVHPSRAEGFGMTPLEAMAAGVPALVSDVGSVREVTGDAAVLLDPDDADAWAAALQALLTDPERRAALVAAGTAHQASFTWRRCADETAAVHDEVLTR
jgi:glycosyltransferase involved in cell wall biosynthesis